MVRNKNKREFSKTLLVQESVLIWIITLSFIILAFYAVFTPLSTILGNLAESSGINEYIVLAITMILNFILEFLYCRFRFNKSYIFGW